MIYYTIIVFNTEYTGEMREADLFAKVFIEHRKSLGLMAESSIRTSDG